MASRFSLRPSSSMRADRNCLCYEKDVCMKCAHRYYLKNNQCMAIPTECFSYDVNSGVCYSCNPGFILNGGLCEADRPSVFFDSQKCFACLPGYKVVNNQCVYEPVFSNDIRTKNILCFEWKGTSCVQCMPGTYLSSRNVCELIDPFCRDFDYSREVCRACVSGYSLRGNRCFSIQ